MKDYLPEKPRKKTLERLNVVKECYNDMLNGALMSHVMDKLQKGEYGNGKKYKYNEAYQVFHDAKNLIKLDFEVEKPFLKEQLYLYLMDIYTNCRESDDRYNAINAINSIAKLTGMYENGQKINIESQGEIKISFGFNNEEDVKEDFEEENEESDV